MICFDMHVHTAEVSPCGNVTAAQTVRLYQEAGYHGICITDHYTRDYFSKIEGEWAYKIDAYLEGYHRAVEAAGNSGFQVFLGMELKLDGANNEYLLYGVTEKFLKKNPELYQIRHLADLKKLAEKTGLLVYQAHPFRPGMVPAGASLLDGIEVYNGNPRHNSRNSEALAYAKMHHMKMISGSDCHEICDVARGGIALEEKVADYHELMGKMTRGAFQLIGC